ncbi:wax ester/triacylglycerol synthase domain-containing protein [Nonomuraea sp. 10N515B]|uniref:wax ester/triacylglycerol synthase domain-containing protein n=1 Tax=Nonomuraea sp. 10N515B TaxID=3457422 RepID=UPI003FCE8BFA
MIERLSIGDLMTIWAEEPGSAANMNIGVAGVLEHRGRVDAESLRAAVDARLDRVPMLRRRLLRTRFGQGRPLWVDDDGFDLARHVQITPLPPNVDFLDWAATRVAEPLVLDRPPWRLIFVTGLDQGLGLVIALHHALADGAAAVALASALLDTSPGAPVTPSSWTPVPMPSPGSLVRDATVAKLTALRRAVIGLTHAPRTLRTARAGLSAMSAALGTHVTPLPLPVARDGRRGLLAITWPLADIARIGHVLGATVNDVALTVTTAAIRHMLSTAGEPVTGRTLRMTVPVAPAPGTRNSQGTAPIIVSVPMDLPDPLLTLARIMEQTTAAKASPARSQAELVPSPLIPPFVMRRGMRWLRRHGGERVHLYVTNVPGPPTPLWLDDMRLTSVYPIAPLVGGMPMAVAVMSYAGTLAMTVNAAPGLSELRSFKAGARNAMEVLGRHLLVPHPRN